jgi:hypothetical protein
MERIKPPTWAATRPFRFTRRSRNENVFHCRPLGDKSPDGFTAGFRFVIWPADGGTWSGCVEEQDPMGSGFWYSSAEQSADRLTLRELCRRMDAWKEDLSQFYE